MSEQITTGQFSEKVLASEKPVLVDFFATWCGPCKMMAPVLEEVASEVANRGAVYKVDVDQEPALAQHYGVMSIPTLILFKDGKPTEQFVGVQPKQTLLNLF